MSQPTASQVAFPLLFVLGGSLICWWWVVPQRRARERRSQLSELLADAGLSHVSPQRLVAACAGLALTVFMAVYVMSDSPAVAFAMGAVSSPLPLAWVRHLRSRRQADLMQVWPDAIEHLASGIRAGLALPEAVSQLSHSGPEALRPAFGAFSAAYRSTGRFTESLDVLKETLADPVGDRVV